MFCTFATDSNFNLSVGAVDCIELSEVACSRGAAQTEPCAHQIIVGEEGEHSTFDQITFPYLLTRKNSHFSASIQYTKLWQHIIVKSLASV